MSLLKRISATIVSQIDHVVGEIENHDAVIKVTLADMSKKIANAKVRYNQVCRDQERIQQQLNEINKKVTLWQQRAISSANNNEVTALECLRRSKQCQHQENELNVILEQYQQTAEKLSKDIKTSQARLTSIKQKQTLMRARESSASALGATAVVEQSNTELLDDTFERWESNVIRNEIVLESNEEQNDPLEKQFISAEEQADLRKELELLLNQEAEK